MTLNKNQNEKLKIDKMIIKVINLAEGITDDSNRALMYKNKESYFAKVENGCLMILKYLDKLRNKESKITYGDKIRSMSDDELVNFIRLVWNKEIIDVYPCFTELIGVRHDKEKKEEIIRKWVQKECE